MSKGLVGMAAAIAALCLAFYRFERGRFTTREIALIACLAALAGLGRIPFAALPGIQPTTFLVILSGFVFGPMTGFLVGALAAFTSNLFLGHGPWTVWQMLAWGVCGGCSGAVGGLAPRSGRIALAAYAAIWGYLFGWMTNVWYWYSFVSPLTPGTWLAVASASFPFDTMHAAANACFMFLLGNGFITALRYFKKRLELSPLTYYDTPEREMIDAE
jgi:energy-coupling factor transport system substrate-specific component